MDTPCGLGSKTERTLVLGIMIRQGGCPEKRYRANGAGREHGLDGREGVGRIEHIPAPDFVHVLHGARGRVRLNVDRGVHFGKLKKGAEEGDDAGWSGGGRTKGSADGDGQGPVHVNYEVQGVREGLRIMVLLGIGG